MSAQPTEPYDASDDLRFVVEEVWAALLGDEVLLPPAEAAEESPTWSGAVAVTGEWQGCVTVELGAYAARELTAQMLALPTGESPVDADIADAVGELVNMVGGNVKALMPGPSALSLPLVAAGRAAYPSDAVELARLDAMWRGAAVRFRVTAPPA